MRINPWMLAGVVAPTVYVAAVVIGGWLTPGYSHVAGPVSALIMRDAPAAWALDPLFTVYNALLIVFAVGLREAFRERGAAIGLVAPTLLAIAGLVGMLTVFYPMDPIGVPLTRGGAMRNWLAGVASVATVLAVLFIALRLRRNPAWRRFVGYSLISLIVIVFTGGLAAALAAHPSPVMGLWERITIGAFLQWVLVLGLILVGRRGRDA